MYRYLENDELDLWPRLQACWFLWVNAWQLKCEAVLPVHLVSTELHEKRERICYAPALNAFPTLEAENRHARKADGSSGRVQTEKRSAVCTRHYEAKNDLIVDLDHILGMDTGIWKDGPDSDIVSLHAVEARFDSIIATEDDILSIKTEICIPPRGLSKTDESVLHNFSV
jgi:hypothetical protein